jgi:hypothetical protein
MRKSSLVLPAAIAALATFGASAAGQAATSSPHPANVVGSLFTTNGTAGYYTTAFGQTFTRVNGTFSLNLQNVADSGGVGIQLCTSSSGHAAQLGAVPVSQGKWAVVFWRGFLVGNPTGNNDPCNGSQLHFGIGGFGVTQLGLVGVGTTVTAQIKQRKGGLLFSVQDTPSVNFNYFLPSFPGHFNEAGAGVSGNMTTLSAPAVNDLTDFSGVTATSAHGVTHGFVAWNTVKVSSSKFGTPPALMTPTGISPAVFTRTWHPGHRYYSGRKGHRHYRWIKGHWTSTGGGPSSFSVLAGTPVGP